MTVDTSKLRADKNYRREIVLTSNARQEDYHLRIKVKTAPLPVAVKKPPYLRLVGICIVVTIVSAILVANGGAIYGAILVVMGEAIREAIFGAIYGAIFGALVGVLIWAIGGAIGGAIYGGIGVLTGVIDLLRNSD